MDIQIINPIDYPAWDDLLLSCSGYTFFHSSAWAKVLHESYHYTPIYFTVFDNGRLLALMPVMEINSFFTGRRGVSLPFTDYSEPIISNGIQFQDVIEHIIEYGKNGGWRFLEIRSVNSLTPLTFPSLTYLRHTLDLSQNEDQIASKFRHSTKRNIKKAIKEGVKVNIFNSLESIKEFYKLNCITRKHHGLPPQPYRFFKKVYDHIICKELGFVVFASFRDKPVAGAVYFHFGKKAVYKYGASDMSFQYLRANNLVMWEAIKWYCKNGYKSLCFGRTEPGNKGLIQFKSGWGTTEQPIHYYRYDLKKNVFIKSTLRLTGFYNKIFRNIPIPILNKVGSILYRHVG